MKSTTKPIVLLTVAIAAYGATLLWAAPKKPTKATDKASPTSGKKSTDAAATKASATKSTTSAKATAATASKDAIVPLMGDTLGSRPIDVGPGDWAAWGGTSLRNNTPEGTNIPDDWDVGEFDRQTDEWKPETARNVKWVAKLGSQTYGNPVVANGKVFVGSNNGGGWLKRYPASVDLGVVLCFNEADGKFLWQHSSDKLPTGRVHDWPLLGLCSTPMVEGDRLWVVTTTRTTAPSPRSDTPTRTRPTPCGCWT
jgi:hypothetical protein